MRSPEDSLEMVAHAFAQAFTDKDVDQIISFFADDSIAMYPRATLPLYGKAANRDAWIAAFNTFSAHPLKNDVVVTAASNDLGYSFGLWATAETEEPGALAGRYTAIWRRNNQQWEIIVLSAHIHEDIRPFSYQPPLP